MSINLSAKRLFDRVWFGKLAGVDALSGTEVIGQIAEPNSERAKLIADIIVGVFGADADDLLSEVGTDGFSKLWDESKYKRHPKGARFGGRFAPKNSAEAIVAVHGAIDEALSGARTEESASELVDLLSNLTVNQLRDIKMKYKISAGGRLKTDLVAKIAERLNAGRRADQSISPAPSRPFHPAVIASTEEQNVIGGWMAYVEDMRAELVQYSPEQQRKRDAMMAVLQGNPLSADQHAAAVEYLNTIYDRNRGQFGVGIADRDRHTDAAGSLLQKLGVDAEAVFMANNPNASPRRVAPAPVRRAPQLGVEIPPEPIVAPVVDRSPMGHRFTSVTTGKDNTSMVQSVLTSPQFSADQIDLLIDVVPGTEYGQLTELIAAVRPELSAAAQSAVNERNAQAAAVRSQMEARVPVSRLTSREERMARARAEVEASRAIGQAAENASRNLNTQVVEPPRLTVPESTEYTRDQIERRLLLDRARRVLQSGNGGITKDRYNRLLEEHEALAAPAGWDSPQAMVMRSFTSEFFSRAIKTLGSGFEKNCGIGSDGFEQDNDCAAEDGSSGNDGNSGTVDSDDFDTEPPIAGSSEEPLEPDSSGVNVNDIFHNLRSNPAAVDAKDLFEEFKNTVTLKFPAYSMTAKLIKTLTTDPTAKDRDALLNNMLEVATLKPIRELPKNLKRGIQRDPGVQDAVAIGKTVTSAVGKVVGPLYRIVAKILRESREEGVEVPKDSWDRFNPVFFRSFLSKAAADDNEEQAAQDKIIATVMERLGGDFTGNKVWEAIVAVFDELLAEDERAKKLVDKEPKAEAEKEFTFKFFSRASKAFSAKSKSDCGANAEGGHGFQPGNTCGKEDGEAAPHTPDPNQRSMKFPGKKKGPDVKPERVNKVSKIKLKTEPINDAVKNLKPSEAHDILRQHKTLGKEHTQKMTEHYAELAEAVMDDYSGGRGVNDKKKAELRYKAELWAILNTDGIDGLTTEVPEPEPINEALSLKDVVQKQTSPADVTNYGVGASPQS
jgi:hypothetical protein